MKKRVLIVLTLLLSLFLVACNNDDKKDQEQGDSNEEKPVESSYSKSLKILAIGNSFSDDGVDNLWKIGTDYGIEEIIIGHLYIGGSSLENHYNNLKNNSPAYTYYKYTGIHRTSEINKTMEYGLLNEEWDIITLQQVSGLSGIYSSYSPYLQELINYIEKYRANSKLGFHMTWAYHSTSTHTDFPRYDRDQIKMYNAIVDVTKKVLADYEEIDFIIPSGTAIQNARVVFGDTLTRDGYHLDHIKGRYVASMQWFKTITGFDVSKIKYRTAGLSIEERESVKSIVEATYLKPFEVSITAKK